jgi:hypothetical protein
MKYTNKDIETLFTYHNPIDIDPQRFVNIRLSAMNLANAIVNYGGKEMDIDIALLKLRECVFYAIGSICSSII